MGTFQKFDFRNLDAIREKARHVEAAVDFAADLSPLARPVTIGSRRTPNAIAILPMEGCDSERDGSPSELVRRRYRRFAAGGAGLLWYEACAVVNEGRANPLQLSIAGGNLAAFASLVEEANRAARESNGSDHRPLSILQLTHSGRYSRPDGRPCPVAPQHDLFLDPQVGLSPEAPVVTDAFLDELVGRYVSAALLARDAGFDGVDLKSCHRYLLSELLACHAREGKYGGSFQNRTRFLLTTLHEVRAAVGPDFIIGCRLNVFDAHPYPYGWGVDRIDCWKPDLSEPLALAQLLAENGLDLLGISAGNPYSRFPEVTRPFDQPTVGGDLPREHPLESVARLFHITRRIQGELGLIPVVGSGYSWLRHYLPQAAAANLASGACSLVGLGRAAFAYPDAPRDILRRGAMDPRKVCIACSKCTQIMRDGSKTGCVVRDSDVYLPLYNRGRAAARAAERMTTPCRQEPTG